MQCSGKAQPKISSKEVPTPPIEIRINHSGPAEEWIGRCLRAGNAGLRVRCHEINRRQQLVLHIRRVQLLALEIELDLLHLGPVFQSNFDLLFDRQDVRILRQADSLGGSELGQDHARISLVRDELLDLILCLHFGVRRAHKLELPIRDFRLGLDYIDRRQRADTNLDFVVRQRLLCEIDRALLDFDVFGGEHQIPIGSLCLSNEVDQLLFELTRGNLLIHLSHANGMQVDVAAEILRQMLCERITQSARP